MKKYCIDEKQEKFEQLDKQTQEELLNWIKEKFILRKTINYNYTSYGLKHLIQHDRGIYTTNEQFKSAMLLCGFKAGNTDKRSWNFNISEKSKALLPYRMW